MVSHAEGSSEAGPSVRPTCAVAVEAEKKRRQRRRTRQRQTPRKKKIILPPPPATAAGGAAQLMDTMEKRGVGQGGAPIHAIEKALTNTDVDVEQCRLQLTPDIVEHLLDSPILTDAEKAELRSGEQGLDVAAVDRVNNEYNMVFKFSGSCKQYRIVKWAQFCVDHDLTAGQTMAVWVYRQPPPESEPDKIGKLGLVLLYYDQVDELNQKEMDAKLLDSGFVDCVRALLMLSQGE